MGDMECSVWDCIVGPADSLVAQSASEQGTIHNQAVKTEGKGHNLGLPHIYCFAGILNGLVKKGDAVGAVIARVLQHFMDRYKVMEWKELVETGEVLQGVQDVRQHCEKD